MKAKSSGPPEPQSRKLRIIAQDPSVHGATGGKILTALVPVPQEDLEPGPHGYRVHVIDYDSSTETLYKPHQIAGDQDSFKEASDSELLANPGFHAQNVYAIVMRTLGAFEFALGRRVSWAFESHQLQVAPHAFAVANAFYSRRDQALLFGYVGGARDRVFTCLSHDVVAHETTHALLDGLRERYMDPSSKDQFAFHEGFADVVALLSVFALEEVVGALLEEPPKSKDASGMISIAKTTIEALENSALLGLGEQIGAAMPDSRGNALRRSVQLKPRKGILQEEEFEEPHRRGEVFVAAMMKSFVHVWHKRISQLGTVAAGKLNRGRVVEDGAKAAKHLMTMAIRALDYCPPTGLTFKQYLSALIAADEDLQPDDSTYGYRETIVKQFAEYGIDCWQPCPWRVGQTEQAKLVYSRTHFEAMQRDPDEVFRFVWENRATLGLNVQAYAKVLSVRPCIRQGSDGFILRETVVEYHQILNLTRGEVAAAIGREIPEKDEDKDFRLYGGGTLIFDEYGRLKYHALNPIPNHTKDKELVAELWDSFQPSGASALSQLHLTRATALPALASKGENEW